MEIRGREIKFLRTVGASCELAELCPDGELNRISELFKVTRTADMVKVMAALILALNKGYEEAKAFDEEGYTPRPLGKNELMLLSDEQFNQLFAEATSAYYGEKPTVEVEPPKKNKKAKAETSD